MKRTIMYVCTVMLAVIVGQAQAQTPEESYVVNPLEVCEPEWQKCSFKLATWNIQFDVDWTGDKSIWETRRPLVRALIQRYRFDIIGTQEPYITMLDDILACSPEYAMVGVSISGEERVEKTLYNVILYRKDRFTVLDHGTFWLSQTPDEPTRGWDANSRRNCNWAKFHDHMTGKDFYHFNMHFDHKGVEARRNSAHLVVGKVKEIAGDLPAFITGDFNTRPDTEPYKILAEAFGDTKNMAFYKTNEEWHSFNGYKYAAAPDEKPAVIDHIFLWRQKYETYVKSWKLINDAFNELYPSDHFPIMIEVAFE